MRHPRSLQLSKHVAMKALEAAGSPFAIRPLKVTGEGNVAIVTSVGVGRMHMGLHAS